MLALLLLSDVITSSVAAGPVPAVTVVAHARLGFDAVEVRRDADPDDPTYSLAIQLDHGWWTGPGHMEPASDGHTCHNDESKLRHVKLAKLALPSKRRAVVAQIDVDFTMYMTCPESPPWKPVPVDAWTERTFLVCAETADEKIACTEPIVTRTRDACTAKATLRGATLTVPCEGNVEPGSHTLDFDAPDSSG
jgi:hypothetical protein